VDADAYLPAANASKDQVIRTFYNRGGQVAGTLDANGYLTRTLYDKAGRVIQESVFGNKATNLTGTFNQVYNSVAKSSAKDAHVRHVYDGQFLRFTIDARGKVTEFIYKSGHNNTANGVVRATIEHAATLGSLSNYTLATVKSAVAALGDKASNRTNWNVYNSLNQLAYTIDATGAVSRISYNADGTVSKITEYSVLRTTNSLPSAATMNSFHNANWSTARITQNYYNAAGQVDYSVDAEGYVTSYTYDRAGRKLTESRWSNEFAFWQTDTENELLALNKGTESKTRYPYQANGALSSVYDPNGTRHLYTYYANGELAWDIRAYGTDEESRTLHINDTAGRTYYTRSYQGSYTDASDPNYRKFRGTLSYFDGLGNVVQHREYVGNHSNGGVDQNTYFEYDKSGNLTKQTNAEGDVTTFEYNAFGQVTKTTDPLNNITTNTYNQAGQLTRSTDAEGYHTDFTYTAFGEQATVKRNNATTTFYYDKLGQVTQVKDALGKSDHYKYDAFGQQIETTNKLGGKTYNTYDLRGQMTQSRVIADVYNHVGTKVATDIINKYEYDSRGNQTKMIEAFGRTEARTTTTYVYDAANQLIQKKGDAVQVYTSGTDSSAATVTPTEYYTYDRRGNLIESKDANGARTLYYYDSMDRVTHQISPEGTLVRNSYDANSNLIETRVYAHKEALPANALGNPPTTTAAEDNAARVTTFEYDRLNRLTDSYVHDVQTAKLETTFTVTRTDNDLRTQYFYDANGNVTKVIDPNGGETRSEYDKLGRKTRQIDAGGFVTDWTYNANGNVTRELKHDDGAFSYQLSLQCAWSGYA